MELKELLAIERPNLAELEQTADLLQKAVDAASKKLVDLAAEDRRQAVNRLRGTDMGAEARQAARVKAEGDRADAAAVLASTQHKIAAERDQMARDAEAKAWRDVRGHLDRRRSAMAEIQKLNDKIVGLYGTVVEAYRQASIAAPRKPVERPSLTLGHFPGHVGVAILADLHAKIGSPLAELRIEPAHLHQYEMAMRPDGLVSYLRPTDDLVLSAENAEVEDVAAALVDDEAA